MKKLTCAAILLALCALGCHGKAKPAAPAKVSPVDVCMAVSAKEAECSDDFVPALVDVRIKLDLPAGIAAAAAAPGGKDQLLAQAKQEWAKDSSEAGRTEMCNKMAPQVPAEIAKAAAACDLKAACKDYVACIIPVEEQIVKGEAAPAPATP